MRQPIPIPSTWKPKARCADDFDKDYRVIAIDVVYHQDKETPMVVQVSRGDNVKWVEHLVEFIHLFELIDEEEANG